MKIVVSAGPTREALDPVRYLSNRSTGKMGYAVAAAAATLGHKVVLVSGPVTLEAPAGVTRIMVESAAEMADAVKREAADAGAVIMAAAVADYRPKSFSAKKIKKSGDDLVIELERTEDILQSLGNAKKPGQILVGFAAETDELLSHAAEKLEKKNLDWIAANLVGVPGRGFAAETNAITLLGRNGEKIELALQRKSDLALELLKIVLPENNRG